MIQCEIIIENTKYNNIKINTKLIIMLLYIIGEGAYGIVLLSNMNKYIIKIIKNKKVTTTTGIEINEYSIFKKLINIPINSYNKNIAEAIAIGYLNNDLIINKQLFLKNTKLLIMPLYDTFYEVNPRYNYISLIYYKDYKLFIINFIYKIIEGLIFLEEQLGIIHLDVKLDNILYYKKELILIDFSLYYNIKNNKLFNIKNNNYKYWPNKKCEFNKIPIYGLAITIIQLINIKHDISIAINLIQSIK